MGGWMDRWMGGWIDGYTLLDCYKHIEYDVSHKQMMMYDVR